MKDKMICFPTHLFQIFSLRINAFGGNSLMVPPMQLGSHPTFDEIRRSASEYRELPRQVLKELLGFIQQLIMRFAKYTLYDH